MDVSLGDFAGTVLGRPRSHDRRRDMDWRADSERRRADDDDACLEEDEADNDDDGRCEVGLSGMCGARSAEKASGTSRTRHENVRFPSLNTDVSGKEENAMLSFSSLLISSGGYINSTSGPSSRSKFTHAKDSIHRCNKARDVPVTGSNCMEALASSESVSNDMSPSSRAIPDML